MQAVSGSGEVDLDTDGKRLARLLDLLLERGLGGGLGLAVLRLPIVGTGADVGFKLLAVFNGAPNVEWVGGLHDELIRFLDGCVVSFALLAPFADLQGFENMM